MARIRTIPQAVKEIKQKDPGTYINVTLLRKLVKKGIIKTVRVDSAHALINLDELEAFLEGCK